jgi:hypothetical protein
MAQTWHMLPGWSKGLLAQALAWALLNSLMTIPVLQTLKGQGPVALGLAQGLVAGLICHRFGLQRWWLVISFLFLPAIAEAQQIMLPSWVYLAALILSLAFFWSVIFRGAPLYLSGPKTWATVTGLLPTARPFRFIDLGSGLGGLAINLSRRHPNGEFHGVEFAPGPWFISALRNGLSGRRVRFSRMDYRKLNLRTYDVVFVFLSPIVMQDIADKARMEMRPGSLLLSLAFPLPGVPPDFTLETDGDTGHLLYGWRIS